MVVSYKHFRSKYWSHLER